MIRLKQMKSIVVAYDKNRIIGRNGELPWAGSLPADMKHFREVTEGGTVIMGRKTYDSLPDRMRPLPNRQNIVLSMGQVAGEGFQVAQSLEDAYSLANSDVISIIGGGQIYELAFPTVDQILATEIDTNVNDGDVRFPHLSLEWHESERQDFESDDRNKYGYSFVTYLRNHPIT